MKKIPLQIIFFISFSVLFLSFCAGSYAYEEGICSWYTRESCIKEGCSGIMANGRLMQNDDLTCASWRYKLGTKIRVTNMENSKYVIATVTDRGPSKSLKGRIIDLSRGAFKEICALEKGLCKVRAEPVSD